MARKMHEERLTDEEWLAVRKNNQKTFLQFRYENLYSYKSYFYSYLYSYISQWVSNVHQPTPGTFVPSHFFTCELLYYGARFFNQSTRCSSVFGPAKMIRMTQTDKFSNRRYHFPIFFVFFYYFIWYLIQSKIKLLWVKKTLKFINMKSTWHDMRIWLK